MKTTSVLVGLMAVHLTAGPLTLLAQPVTNNRPVPRRGGMYSDRIRSIVQRDDFGAFAVLTPEQRESYRVATDGQRDKTRDLEGKIRDARKEMVASGLAEKFDEDAVRAKALEVAKLEAELSVLRAKALSKVKPPLSKEQIEQIKNPRAMSPYSERIAPLRRSPTAGPRDEHDLPKPTPKPEQ